MGDKERTTFKRQIEIFKTLRTTFILSCLNTFAVCLGINQFTRWTLRLSKVTHALGNINNTTHAVRKQLVVGWWKTSDMK